MTSARTDLELRLIAKDEASKVLADVGQSAGGLKSALGDVAKVATGFLAANVISNGVSQLTGFIGTAISEAADLEQSIGGVESVFKESANSIFDFGKTAANTVGLSKNEFNQLASATGAFLKNYGFDTEGAADQTVELTKRAADMAAMFGGTVPEAMTAIQAALRGQADPIERYGVSISAARVEMEALAMTGKSTASELTDQEKMAARLAIIFNQTADAAGQFAREEGTAAGQAERLRAQQANLAAELGTKLLPIQVAVTKAKLEFTKLLANVLIPVVTKAADAFFGLIEPIVNFGRKVIEMAGYLYEGAITVDDFSAKFEGYSGVLQFVAEAVGKFVLAFRYGFGVISDILGENNDNVYGLARVIGEDLAFAFHDIAMFVLRDLIPGLKELAGSIATFIGNVAEAVAMVVKWYVESGLLGAALEGVKTIAAGLWEVVKVGVDLLTDLVKWLTENKVAAAVVAAGLVALVAALAPVPVAILAIVTAVGLLSENWDAIKAKAVDVWENAIPGIFKVALGFIYDNVKTRIEGVLQVIESVFGIIQGVIQTAVAIWQGDWQAAWDGMKQTLDSVMDLLIGTIKTTFGNIPEIIVNALGDLGNLLYNAGMDLINGLIRGIEDKIPSLNGVLGSVTNLIPSWKGPPEKDARLLYRNGQLIMQGFINGIDSMIVPLSSQLADIVHLIDSHIAALTRAGLIGAGAPQSYAAIKAAVQRDLASGTYDPLAWGDLTPYVQMAHRELTGGGQSSMMPVRRGTTITPITNEQADAWLAANGYAQPSVVVNMNVEKMVASNDREAHMYGRDLAWAIQERGFAV